MSPHAVNNFVQDLVEMAKAMEELPQVKAQFQEVADLLEEERKTVQDRELAIIDYKATIDDLQKKVRELEVARDDAELRFLESEEHAHAVLTAIKGATATLGQAVTVLDPPKPEPQTEPTEPMPRPDGISWASHDAPPVQGQSEVDPTSANTTASTVSEPTVNTDAASTLTSQSEPVAQPKPGPYAGWRYHDFPKYVQRSDWLAGGGTEADYDWRPSPISSSGSGF